MTQLEFLEEGLKQEFLNLSLSKENIYMLNCKSTITCDICQYKPNCYTISCWIETSHPELFQQLKDKCPHLVV